MWVLDRIRDFFSISPLMNAWEAGQFSLAYLTSREGLQAVIMPVFPLLLAIEMLAILFMKRKIISEFYTSYKIPIVIYSFNKVVLLFFTFNSFLLCYTFFAPYALFNITYEWYYFLLAYIVWEFSHFIYHFTSHKVRILWCVHATHHAPTHMNLTVLFTDFFLQGVYATILRVSICTLVGIPLPMLLFVMVIDGCWGSLIHISENMLPNGKLGILGKIILTPSHHRVHHAKNSIYIDKNYCNLLNVWDRIFGTYKEEIKGVPPQYGVAREINHQSFYDVYFGEFYCLLRDIKNAHSFKKRLQLVVMPPGWKPKSER